MTSFVHVDYPSEHPGVVRAERVLNSFKQLKRGFDGNRASATLLLAAVVSALLVVANEVVETWSEGHLLAAWVVMWALAFAAIALFAAPAKGIVVSARATLVRWAAARRQAAEDEKLWNAALDDARIMADISRAMTSEGTRSVRAYY